MIFRFYLPLYSLLKQTGEHEELQSAIKTLLMDEKAASFVRKLMRDMPQRSQKKGKKKPAKQVSYSETIALFLSNPSDVANNRDLILMEQSLELTLNMIVSPNEVTVAETAQTPIIENN